MLAPFRFRRRQDACFDLDGGDGGGGLQGRAPPTRPHAGQAAPRQRGITGSEAVKIIAGLAVALGISLLIRSINGGLDHPMWHL